MNTPAHSRTASASILQRLTLFLAISMFLVPASLTAAEITVVAYNLRYASSQPPNAWPNRRPLVKEVLQQIQPDLLGTQEGVWEQLKDVHRDLPDYDWIGLGRDGGSRGEFMAVFYRRDRFDPLEYDHFWLSDTPEVIASSTWGNTNKRMVTWVRFKDRTTGREFYFWNTHFDHALQPAREKAAAMVRQRIEALNTSLPVILVGDFNAPAGANPAFNILVEGDFLRDSWDLASQRLNADFNTFNGFGQARRNGQRIDWILLRGKAEVRTAEIVTFSKDDQYPSDHFPVVARLTLID
jgi:endonuclease/exonuclease/phosphatase family metal-dependent hydrolase